MVKVRCHYINNKEEKFDSDKLLFRPSVYGLLIKDNKIVLIKQRGGYDFPGGGIKIHETIEEALKREFWEETGLRIKPVRVIHCQTSFFVLPSLDQIKRPRNCVMMYYICELEGGKFSIKNFSEFEKFEALYPEWVELNKIDQIKFQNSVDSPMIITNALKMI